MKSALSAHQAILHRAWSSSPNKTQSLWYISSNRRCYSSTCNRSRGRFSSLMDLGGAPSTMAELRSVAPAIDAAKKLTVRAVAVDFHLLSSIHESANTPREATAASSSSTATQASKTTMTASNNNSTNEVEKAVNSFASMLGVSLGGEGSKGTDSNDDPSVSELEALIGGGGRKQQSHKAQIKQTTPQSNPKHTSTSKASFSFRNDVREKYAAKLRAKNLSLQGAELAKQEASASPGTGTSSSPGGDAKGHLLARRYAMGTIPSRNTPTNDKQKQRGSQWMASTGAATLFLYLQSRSMRCAWLPSPAIHRNAKEETVQSLHKHMEELEHQLASQVSVHCKMYDPRPFDTVEGMIHEVLRQVFPEEKDFATNSNQPGGKHGATMLVISDQDAHLRAAKNEGHYTCRIRAPNARRGNVTAHYTVQTLEEVLEKVDELNGISYSSIQKRGGA